MRYSARSVATAIAVLAGVGLAYQVSLTRIFSLLFQYHYVFLIVSLAIFGLGLGAALGYVARGRGITRTVPGILLLSILALGTSFPFSAVFLSQNPTSSLAAAAIALLPYALLGWVNALVYADYAPESSVIYAADLIGAAVGLIGAPLLLIATGPFGSVVLLGALSVTAALLLAPSAAQRLVPGVAFVALLALALVNTQSGWIAYDPTDIRDAPPDKTMIRVLNEIGGEVIETEYSAFAQVDVVGFDDDPNTRLVFTDAGAGSFMWRYDPDGDQNFGWLYDRNVEFLPFLLGPVNNTLVIGAGAGYDVLLALEAGADAVTAVEINPAIVEVTRDQADFNGGILDLPNVNTVITDGRNFAERSDDRFDLVYLNVVYTQAATPGVSALSENYAFTVEALRAYWGLLNADGRVAFVTHNGLEGLRLMMTALRALEEEGFALPDALKHVALVRLHDAPNPTVATGLLIIQRQPFTEESAAEFGARTLALTGDPTTNQTQWMDPLYVPYQFEGQVSGLVNGTQTLDEYLSLDTGGFNIFPTTDNRPFFYHLDEGLPGPLRDLLMGGAALTVGFFIVISFLQPKNPHHEWTRVSLSFFFLLLGVGFLLAEVSLHQQFRLLLGDPVLSLVITVGALLLGGGVGSFVSRRFAAQPAARAIWIAAGSVGVWLVLATVVYPEIVRVALSLPLVGRVIVAAVALLPLGFLMGIPFPLGLRLAGEADPGGVPLFWGMNALASTLGAALATVIALLAGFDMALYVAAGAYLLVAGLVGTTWRRVIL